jgi:protein-S-isoprenylcysteine O-methyltransferase Ste14
MANASLVAHLRDIILLPFTVTVIVPFLIYEKAGASTPPIYFKLAGIVIGSAGLFLFFYTVLLFRLIGKGTLAPWSKKQKLIVEGPYRYCRNPMISGVLFILIGEGLWFFSFKILMWALTFFVINTVYFLFAEEPALERAFGDEYKQYKRRVPRWLPNIKLLWKE